MSWILCYIIIIIIIGMCTSAYIFCVSNYFGLRKTRPDWGVSWIAVFHARGNKQVSSVTTVWEAVRGRAGSGDWGLPLDGEPVTLGLSRLCPGQRRRALANLASQSFQSRQRNGGGSPRLLTAFRAVTLSAPRVTGRGLWGRGF